MQKHLPAFVLLFLFSLGAFSQSDSTGYILKKKKIHVHDSLYFKTFDELITGRVYLSRKFTSMNIDNKEAYSLNYIPNTSLNLGIGATYKFATLNIAIGFGFLNPNEGEGDTRYLDLQFHSYGKKVMLDVFGQFYNGFYLDPKGKATTPDRYYVRPDMSVMELGTSAQYIFNNKRFSYRSSFVHNEWQKKSAGTFLAGIEMFYGDSRFDSTAIPTLINPEQAMLNYKRMNFAEAGINGGYAYTLVIKKHFFIHASLTISLDYGGTKFYGDKSIVEKVGVGSNNAIKTALGYNSENWIINMQFISANVYFNTTDKNQDVSLSTGNVRLILAKRFLPGKKLKSKLKIIDKI